MTSCLLRRILVLCMPMQHPEYKRETDEDNNGIVSVDRKLNPLDLILVQSTATNNYVNAGVVLPNRSVYGLVDNAPMGMLHTSLQLFSDKRKYRVYVCSLKSDSQYVLDVDAVTMLANKYDNLSMFDVIAHIYADAASQKHILKNHPERFHPNDFANMRHVFSVPCRIEI